MSKPNTINITLDLEQDYFQADAAYRVIGTLLHLIEHLMAEGKINQVHKPLHDQEGNTVGYYLAE